MQNDLISRSALLEAITFDRKAAKVHPQEICERFERFCDYAEEVVMEAPAVDAEVVRCGEWKERIVTDYKYYPAYTYKSGYECSLCGRTERTNKEPYCHCGARMDGDVNA